MNRPEVPQDPQWDVGGRDLGQVDLDPADRPPPTGGSPHRSRGLWLAGIALLLLLALGLFWFLRDREPPAPPPSLSEEEATPGTGEAGTVEQDESEPEIVLPPLDASDPLVRELIAKLSENPRIAAWLVSDELVRRFVVTVDNIAEGVSPRKHLTNLAPAESLRVAGEGGETVLDPESYRRYDAYAEAFESLDTEGTVKLYRQLEPLIDQAYRDLGYPRAEFDETLLKAIRRLLRTPVVEGEIPLVEKTKSYEIADRQLESLSPAQKNLLRTGPENTRRIQAKLRELAVALGADESRLPRAQVYRADVR